MKTEPKTIKCWASVSTSPDMQKHPSQFNILNCVGDAETHTESQNMGKWNHPWITVPCTITLEIPVEDEKVMISESDFDKAWTEAKADNYPVGMINVEDLKNKIFKRK